MASIIAISNFYFLIFIQIWLVSKITPINSFSLSIICTGCFSSTNWDTNKSWSMWYGKGKISFSHSSISVLLLYSLASLPHIFINKFTFNCQIDDLDIYILWGKLELINAIVARHSLIGSLECGRISPLIFLLIL